MATGKQQFIQACQLLDLPYKENPRLELRDGTILKAQIYVPNFSSSNGIWVADLNDESYEQWNKHRDELTNLGASASFMELIDETKAPSELEDFKDMFCEWGWTGDPKLQPDWIVPGNYHKDN